MCHWSCLAFVRECLREEEVRGKRVIEVGAYDINGSARSIVEAWEPAQYIGIDLLEGPGVDEICDAGAMVERFGPESFDLVISTEMLEHAQDWRRVVSNLKGVCKPKGTLLLTTRAPGFALHEHPHDYWRFDISDIQRIFVDCQITALQGDPQVPGVFVKATKALPFFESDLSNVALFDIHSGKLRL